MVTYTYPIWLFFAAFFFYLSFVNWRESWVHIRPFTIRGPDRNPDSEAELGEANRSFVQEFNAYLTGINKANRGRHRAAAIGYALSGVIALASMFLLLVG